MIRPFSPHEFESACVPPSGASSHGAWVFAFHGRELLLERDSIAPLSLGRLREAYPNVELSLEYLGRYRDEEGPRECFVCVLPSGDQAPMGLEGHGLRRLYELGFGAIGLVHRAVGVRDWLIDHDYCGRCGQANERVDGERSRQCSRCDLRFYPRVSPAVIVAIRRGEELLMARAARFPTGLFSLIAGFVDAGESAEEAIMREVWEEVGLGVRNIEYFSSQSWPHPNSLMLGFRAEYASGELRVDGREIVEAGWYTPDAMPPRRPGSYSIAQRLIADHLRRFGGHEIASA